MFIFIFIFIRIDLINPNVRDLIPIAPTSMYVDLFWCLQYIYVYQCIYVYVPVYIYVYTYVSVHIKYTHACVDI